MSVKEYVIATSVVPHKIRNISQPPDKLFVHGCNVNELLLRPCITIVGSRKVSAYGRQVTAKLAGELARAGIVIISGLALGVDSIAHQAALDAGGVTLAVLPSPLNQIYPRSHLGLAERIVRQGGALLSEYPPGASLYPMNFIARNRIAAACCDVLLITEAAEKSGTLHTAGFALEQGKPVLAVPGNITSPTSAGTNNLIKTGAAPVTCVEDVLQALGLEPAAKDRTAPKGATPNEQGILDLLVSGICDGATLLTESRMEVSQFNQALTMLEIRGQIRALGNNQWGLQ
ncbi:MAG TPA: DNA-processing protein DprA [Candidatus Saccharimonadales bacterium]|nr:DNA-processing protein DprA [Candidatus Saccharimonadales bacterium]